MADPSSACLGQVKVIDLGISLIAMRLVAYGFAQHAHGQAVAAKARYDAAKAEARKQYPKTAHEIGELALVRTASASWLLERLAMTAKGRGLTKASQPAKLLGGRSLEHAVKRIQEADQFRVRMNFAAQSVLSDVVGIAILTRRVDRLGLVPIPALHYPIENLLTDVPFGGVVADLAAELHIYTLGDLLGDLFVIWSIKRTIDMFSSVGKYYEMAERYNSEAAQLERLTAQLIRMENSARQLREDHPAFCNDALKWLVLSQEGERLGTALTPQDARWIALELTRAVKAYVDHLEAPVAGAEDGIQTPDKPRETLRLRLGDLLPAAIARNLKEAFRLISDGRAHQRATNGERLASAVIAAKIPILEPALRQEVGHMLSRRRFTRWAA